MKRFLFQPEAVLHLRREQEELEQTRLQQECAKLNRLQAARECLLSELGLAQAHTRRDRPEEMIQLGHFRRHMVQRLNQSRHQITEQQAKVDAQRARLLEARRQVELLQKLRNSQLAEWSSLWNKEQEELASESHLARLTRERR